MTVVSVVVPAFNEAEAMVRVLEKIAAQKKELI